GPVPDQQGGGGEAGDGPPEVGDRDARRSVLVELVPGDRLAGTDVQRRRHDGLSAGGAQFDEAATLGGGLTAGRGEEFIRGLVLRVVHPIEAVRPWGALAAEHPSWGR